MENVIASMLGIIGATIHIFALANICDVRMKQMTALSSVFMVGYFFLLGLPIAAFCTIIGIIRYYLASKIEGNIWVLFACFYISVAILTPPADIIHIFPAIASVIGTYALFNMKGLRFRTLMAFMTFLWVCYGFYSDAYVVIIKESILLGASAFAVYKLIYGDPFVGRAFSFKSSATFITARFRKV